jgi:hypothetical protein
MPKPFRGVINVDVTQSVPDWEPYTQPIASEGTPNVLYVVLDDVGYSALRVGEETVGQGRIMTQPGKFSIAGEGLNIGKDGSEPVTDDYPGQAPWPFTGGTIRRAVVDVSGHPFVDLAAEARMAYLRD